MHIHLHVAVLWGWFNTTHGCSKIQEKTRLSIAFLSKSLYFLFPTKTVLVEYATGTLSFCSFDVVNYWHTKGGEFYEHGVYPTLYIVSRTVFLGLNCNNVRCSPIAALALSVCAANWVARFRWSLFTKKVNSPSDFLRWISGSLKTEYTALLCLM